MEQEDQSLNQIKTFLKENNNLWKKKKKDKVFFALYL